MSHRGRHEETQVRVTVPPGSHGFSITLAMALRDNAAARSAGRQAPS
jgi:hypothetical protein